MSKPKYTPGPWKMELHEGEYLISGRTDGHEHFTAIARQEANARLIAAAPELLESLLDLLIMVGAPDAPWDIEAIVSRANAAIAKAEGSSRE